MPYKIRIGGSTVLLNSSGKNISALEDGIRLPDRLNLPRLSQSVPAIGHPLTSLSLLNFSQRMTVIFGAIGAL
jgi:hypothetical protein